MPAAICAKTSNAHLAQVGTNGTSLEIQLTCDGAELFLDLLPVHHMPPIRNVFGSLVVVLEIIRVFPNIET
jgi:hypothetical protein